LLDGIALKGPSNLIFGFQYSGTYVAELCDEYRCKLILIIGLKHNIK
jgi:hypothetical protein